MAYAFSNEKATTCSKTYDNKRRTQDTPARSSEKTLMQKRTLKNEAVVRSSRKWVVSFATHLKWEYWLLGVATFTNKGSCLEEDVKHRTNNEFLFPNIVLSKERSTSEMVPGKAHSFSHEPGLEI